MVKSKQPRKQHKASAQTPQHVKRKHIRARLIDDRYLGIRSITIRVGDEVEILRGDFGNEVEEGGKRHGGKRTRAGKQGKVLATSLSTGTIHVEGCTQKKADGKEVPLPIHPSNVIVTKVDDSDPLRKKSLKGRMR